MTRNIPRRKRFNRNQRLQSGPSFIKNYSGKNIVTGYSKFYGVDKLCTIKELGELEVIISDEYEKSICNQQITPRRRDIIEDVEEPRFFIVGETSNGVPFGVICDENVEYLDEQVYYRELD